MVNAVTLTFVFPVYNEESRIDNLRGICQYFRNNISLRFEILVVCNGCTDATYKAALNISKQFPEMRILDTAVRGRGHALKLGFSNAFGSLIAVCAIDRAWDEDFYVRALKLIEAGNYDVILGPKTHAESIVERPNIRGVLSFLVRRYIGFLFGIKVGDVNCIKVFNKKKCDFIINLGNYNYFAETEFFLLALENNCKIHSIPVKVFDNNVGSKVKVASLIQFFIESVRFKLKRSLK